MILGINVTPMVDIVLVLLIILMVTASYTVSRVVPLELPKASTGESTGSDPLAISIDQDGKLFLDGNAVSPERLRRDVHQVARKGPVRALIAADGRTAHASVIRVMDLLRSEGVTKFAINVSPEELVR